MRLAPVLALGFLGTVLGGCTTFGTNVNGSFRCDAPDGVCAPSTVIDDSAIARIEETTSTELLNPAGPYRMDDGIEAPVRGTVIAEADHGARPAPSYELSIVFPGYTDAAGTAHARRVVRTEAVLPGRGDAMEGMARRGRQPARNRGLLAAAESAPPFLAIAPSLGDTPQSASGEQRAEVAVGETPNPIEAIEAQVTERLAAQKSKMRREAATFSGIVE